MEKINIKQLDFLIDKWDTDGTVAASGATQPMKFKGTDTYDYILDGQFILHTVDVVMGQEHIKTLELIGIDQERQLFVLTAFDNSGSTSSMTATIVEGVLHISGKNMRSQLTVTQPSKKLSAVWEKSTDDQPWKHWMDLELTQQKNTHYYKN